MTFIPFPRKQIQIPSRCLDVELHDLCVLFSARIGLGRLLIKGGRVNYVNRSTNKCGQYSAATSTEKSTYSGISQYLQHSPQVSLFPSLDQDTSRRKPVCEEESALLSLRDNDYGYIPPGFGLNGNIISAVRSLGGRWVSVSVTSNSSRCSCEPHSMSAALDDIPLESVTPMCSRKQRRDALAKKIDTISSFSFPFLFCCFNILYWNHYLRSPTND